MAFVSVPKDLTKVKNKIILEPHKTSAYLSWHCCSSRASVLFPGKRLIGSSNAATGMCLLMLPAFLFAMYEKDGLPLEKVLKNMITVKFIRPPVRKYEVENLYEKKRVVTKTKGGTVRGKEENDKWLPDHDEDSSYLEDWWLDEEDSADDLPVFDPDEAEDYAKDRQRLTGVPMVTGYEALERHRGIRRPRRKLSRREQRAWEKHRSMKRNFIRHMKKKIKNV